MDTTAYLYSAAHMDTATATAYLDAQSAAHMDTASTPAYVDAHSIAHAHVYANTNTNGNVAAVKSILENKAPALVAI